MRILAVDSSAVSASAAVLEDGKLLAQQYTNNRLTHSQTLMPMIENILKNADIPLDSIDYFAVCTGPGSFTGIRIGVACIKGLAFAKGKPCVGVSTLSAIAHSFSFLDGTLCAVMDARCGQVYNALFDIKDSDITALCEDRAISIEELKGELLKMRKPVWLAGDGADIVYNALSNDVDGLVLASENLKYQSAYGAAYAAMERINKDEVTDSSNLVPIYLRLPQAERELKKKQLKKEN